MNGATAPSEDGSSMGLPEYMQESCESWEDTLRQAERRGHPEAAGDAELIWAAIRHEAQGDAAQEPLLSSFLYASILSHDNFERSLAFVLSNRLSDATFLSTELFEVFYSILRAKPEIAEAALADLRAVRERDPACMSYSQALLHFKGFHAIEAYRIAHELWGRGRKVMAVALQSRMSEVFAVDIHPAARFGKGILLDHGTGVVIGETAELGNNVSILQNVTLGGTGKVHGDRHPKISDNVLIGASASILGNIRIGKGAQVAAGSLVLKPVPPHTLVAGSPAKEIGRVTGNPALNMEQWCIDTKDLLKSNLEHDPFATTGTPRRGSGSSSSGGSSDSGGSMDVSSAAGSSAQQPAGQAAAASSSSSSSSADVAAPVRPQAPSEAAKAAARERGSGALSSTGDGKGASAAASGGDKKKKQQQQRPPEVDTSSYMI
ncbi:serine acetyltransferase 2 [Micractinium conductrix]|uniref:serine O-acetyltransferase n=1 Tax=Micractinium conductrix TaxID=554055 RepID=A0A2P6VHA5_9CHLO|nr:serine acetyltransferase 2 [Micractinium conductrix]|eukprot:PSC73471.1 serine acetyltransferase 2 [Micractinium conductrix]